MILGLLKFLVVLAACIAAVFVALVLFCLAYGFILQFLHWFKYRRYS